MNTPIKDGGPAFPQPLTKDVNGNLISSNDKWTGDAGMTLRDWFAGMALIGYRGHPANDSPVDCSTWAYKVADALISEREKMKQSGEV